MKAPYELVLDAESGTGLLSITSEGTGIKDSLLAQWAEREAAKGYIMSDELGGFCRFDITTILGDMMNENDFFDFIEATVNKPVPLPFFRVRDCLEEYFSAGDFSVQRISQLMGRYRAPFGETGKTGKTFYHCLNLQQIAVSILHFLILEGYKFMYCRHCGRLYATKTKKIIYCNRRSTFEGYERYACKDAVKRIVDSLNKRFHTVDERLRYKVKKFATWEDDNGKIGVDRTSKYYKMHQTFGIKCEQFKAKIKNAPTVENLKEYRDFLYDNEDLPKRYERIRETMR